MVDQVKSPEAATTQRITIAEYQMLPETNLPMQLIDGEVIMAPSPEFPHQKTVTKLTLTVGGIVNGGELCIAPMDVYLDEINAVQPDLFWVSAENDHCKLVEGYWYGAPDFVIEVLSPSTARLDRSKKFKLYEKYGVCEYWMVDPAAQFIEVWQLVDQKFVQLGVFGPDEQFQSAVLGQVIELKTIFS
ncbi:MAG: restriction endonuclease [Chloroflexota bacterium]|nr:Uma2 family endonuclease [Chloroflexota bacterium]GIK66533.1 MAG: restriction endonuclease [Chloroflexota bacterium]